MPEKNPQNRRLGYARASTYGQTLGAQFDYERPQPSTMKSGQIRFRTLLRNCPER